MVFDPRGPYPPVMETKPTILAGVVGFVFSAIVLPLQTGCVAEGHTHTSASVHADVVLDDDDYVYYPEYEVYYSSRHRNYVYLDGRTWVRRPAPSGISVDVLLASPSVHVDFHDAPARHHDRVIRTYPRNWRPSGHNHGPRDNDRRRDRRNDRDDDRDHDRRDGRRSHYQGDPDYGLENPDRVMPRNFHFVAGVC